MSIVDILARIGFDWKLALMNVVNVGILFWILKKFLFEKITRMLDGRRKMIKESMDKARQAETDLKMATKKAQDIIDTAKGEASRAIEAAYQDAKELTTHMRERSQKEIEVLVLQAKKAITKERETMYESLQQEMAVLIVAAVEKVVSEKMDEKKDAKLITSALSSST